MGDIEELFNPLTKFSNTHSEQDIALGEQTLRSLDWKNQELDKQTKMIEQTRNKALMMSIEALMNSDEALEETRDIAPVYVDTKTTKDLHSIQLILD